MIRITRTLSIADSEIQEQFIRASGPGGQNVNKVSSAVQLRFDVVRSPSLPEEVRARLIVLAGRRISQDGILTIEAQRFRTQGRNRDDARVRLVELIRHATEVPELRRATRPTRASQRRRLESKQRRGDTKKQRRTVAETDG
ncbi:aminoacyl-tRNA hydrolase [Sulfuriferula plumbiphila]|uniref:Aminoacyl-tRNA hydrolase n=1 Tax=Sulfuriferula plumbiphila TaxID=171865 RepID=A0A512L955_9PROT|nr:alternative ribosome rescue aminoacyl-tRNA hydrolase ArfB [Sulfuriferula plumbiphila]BBP04391.1 aminoacyl-tRNA hydrolase [Sulfuriferula plumbiphila]GEP30992.1 aminoacyl-tRNA hydrolase [Sulfuriferula plumbiphila]